MKIQQQGLAGGGGLLESGLAVGLTSPPRTLAVTSVSAAISTASDVMRMIICFTFLLFGLLGSILET